MRSIAMIRWMVFGAGLAGVCGTMGLLGFGCSNEPKAEELISTEVELNDEQKVQNVVSFPFRVIGGAAIYPFKVLFEDLPSSVARAFDDELEPARKRLKSTNLDERLLGIAELGVLERTDAVALLLTMLDDPQVLVRREVVLSLSKLPRELLREGEKQTKPPVALESRLTAMLGDSDPGVQGASALALAAYGSTRAVAVLKERMRRGANDEMVCSFFLLARARLLDRGAESVAVAWLREPRHPVVHANSLLALAHLGGDIADYELARALANPDERLVIAAITGYGIQRNFGMLLSLARSGTPLQQRKSLLALGEFGGAEMVGVLERYRQSTDPTIRTAAIFGLATAGYPRVVPYLIEMLQAQDALLRLQALSFLMRLTGRDFGLEPSPWRKWWNDEGGDFVNRAERQPTPAKH